MKGDGELDVLVQGESIGKIISPGLEKPIPINTGEIDLYNEFVDRFATITPEGQIILNTEAIISLEEFDDLMAEADKTELKTTNGQVEGCSLFSILNKPKPIDSTQSLLVLIALMVIMKKLKQ
jgi:hypothetical protein